MKTIIASAILLLILSSCSVDPSQTYRPIASARSSEEMVKQVITALHHESSQEYVALFPTLEEFHQMMDKNSDFYGEYLSDAKQEFANTYESQLVTAVKESFHRVIREGNKKGIAWSAVRFQRIDTSEKMDPFAQAQVSIVFTANGTTHRIILDRALILNEKWKVSQFIRLV